MRGPWTAWRRLVQAMLLFLLMAACIPIFSPKVSAFNPFLPSVVVASGDPVMGGTPTNVTLDFSNPASNKYNITFFDVVAPFGWTFNLCAGGASALVSCLFSSKNANYSGFLGTSLPPGATVILTMGLVSPTGSYPTSGTFPTFVVDTSNGTQYPGPELILLAIDPTTTISVTPAGTTPYVAGTYPPTVEVGLSPPQQGVPVEFSVSGYNSSDAYTLSPNLAVSDTFGLASTLFTPSQRNGASAVVTVRVGSSSLAAKTGPFVTLSPGPSVTLSPNSGPTGTSVKLSGVGFLVGGVQVNFGSLTVANVNVTSSGSPFSVGFPVPDFAPGNYTVIARGQAGLRAVSTFAVLAAGPQAFDFAPSLSMNGTVVGPGQDFSTTIIVSAVFGTPGFVTLSVSSPAGVSPPTLSAGGGFPTFQANLSGKSPLVSGTYSYLVTASSGNVTHQVRYSVVVPQSSITLSSSSAAPGSSVNVTGTNFPPSTQLTINLGQDEVATATTGADGTFQTAIVVPGVSPGNYNVTIAGGTFPLSAPLAVVGSSIPSWVYPLGLGGAGVAGAIGLAVMQYLRVPKVDDLRFGVEVVPVERVAEDEGNRR
jgi:hypothetical protein